MLGQPLFTLLGQQGAFHDIQCADKTMGDNRSFYQYLKHWNILGHKNLKKSPHKTCDFSKNWAGLFTYLITTSSRSIQYLPSLLFCPKNQELLSFIAVFSEHLVTKSSTTFSIIRGHTNIEVASARNGVWNQNFWVGLLLTATANGQIDLMEILCLIYVHESLHILRKWLLGSKIIYKLQYSATFPARSTQKLTELYFSVCVLREAVGVVII